MGNNGYITENIDSWKDHFRLVLKKLKMFDKLGIKWIPRRWEYIGKWDTFDMQVLLPDYNSVMEVRVKVPQFDDGRMKYGNVLNDLFRIDENGQEVGARECFHSMAMLFEVLKDRHERGDSLIQSYEYRKAHNENTSLAWYRKCKAKNGVK